MQPPLGFRDDPRFAQVMAPKGSGPWAEYHRKKLQEALDLQIKGGVRFSSELGIFWEHEGWQALLDRCGKPFPSFRAFAAAPRPYGLGCDKQRLPVVLRASKQILKAVGAPKGNRNAAKDKAENKVDIINFESKPSGQGGTSASYLMGRLQRDFPDIAQRLANGEFKSVAAAARAAGLEKSRDPVEAIVRMITKLSARDRARLMERLKGVG